MPGSIPQYAFIRKKILDTITASELSTKEAEKLLAELSTLDEAFERIVSSSKADAFALNESISNTISKTTVESFSISEALEFLKTLIRTYNDSLTMGETVETTRYIPEVLVRYIKS